MNDTANMQLVDEGFIISPYALAVLCIHQRGVSEFLQLRCPVRQNGNWG